MLSKDVPLPKILQGKLEFGNRDQINALRDCEIEIAKQEEKTKLKLEGKLKKYRAKIFYKGTDTFDVWAKDKSQAEEVANEIETDEPWDWEVDYINIYEAKD